MHQSVKCHFCGKEYPLYTEYDNSFVPRQYSREKINLGTSNEYFFDVNFCGDRVDFLDYEGPIYKINISQCPHCAQNTISIELCRFEYFLEKTIRDSELINNIRPKFTGIKFPDCVPLAIRKDYEEATAIVNISPKASALLARRALEGMILDCWNIPAKAKGNLKSEVAAIRGKIPEGQWNAIDALRDLGNIGAHMENDVDSVIEISTSEAEKLIQLVENLIKQWYVTSHKDETLYSDIININSTKQNEREKVRDSKSHQSAASETITVTNNAQINGNYNMNFGNININTISPNDSKDKK